MDEVQLFPHLGPLRPPVQASLQVEDLTPELFQAMEATAKRALDSEAWRMRMKLEVEIPSGVHGEQAEEPGEGETLADLRRFCPVTDPWVSWDKYAFNAHTEGVGINPRN